MVVHFLKLCLLPVFVCLEELLFKVNVCIVMTNYTVKPKKMTQAKVSFFQVHYGGNIDGRISIRKGPSQKPTQRSFSQNPKNKGFGIFELWCPLS